MQHRTSAPAQKGFFPQQVYKAVKFSLLTNPRGAGGGGGSLLPLHPQAEGKGATAASPERANCFNRSKQLLGDGEAQIGNGTSFILSSARYAWDWMKEVPSTGNGRNEAGRDYRW